MNITSSLKTPGRSMRTVLALLLTLGGFLSLAAGNFFFSDRSPSLINEILSYLIPITYMILSHYLLKKSHLLNETFFNKKVCFCCAIKTIFFGILFMFIPISLSFLGQVLPHLGKQPATGYQLILLQIILLNLLVGIFEEGLFRHLIFKLLIKDPSKKSLLYGFFMSSLLFGILHFGNLTVAAQKPITVTSQVIYAFFLGMLFAALYLRYQSFAAIAFLHGFVDFLTSVPQLYGQTDSIASADITIMQGVITVGLLLPSGLLGILLLILFIKKQTPNHIFMNNSHS